MKEEIITEILNLEEGKLFQELGTDLFSPNGHLGFGSDDNSDQEGKARMWWSAKFSEIRSEVCESKILNDYSQSADVKRKIEICSGIADLFIAQYSEFTACTISVLLFNYGLDKLCNKEASNSR